MCTFTCPRRSDVAHEKNDCFYFSNVSRWRRACVRFRCPVWVGEESENCSIIICHYTAAACLQTRGHAYFINSTVIIRFVRHDFFRALRSTFEIRPARVIDLARMPSLFNRSVAFVFRLCTTAWWFLKSKLVVGINRT